MAGYVVAVGPNAIDEYYTAEHWPRLGDKSTIKYLRAVPGGMVPNAASILAGYGMKVYSLDVLGEDEYTEVILADLADSNVLVEHIEIHPNVKNTKTHIILAENDRVVFIVQNKKPKISYGKKDLLLGAAYVYSTIKDMKNLENDKQLIKELRKNKVKIFYDVEMDTFIDAAMDDFYFSNADVLMFNESGFEKYAGGRPRKEVDAELFNKGVEVISTTLGEKGFLARTKTASHQMAGVAVEIKDTTGAGDTFNATLLYGLSLGWDLQKATYYANYAAARSITYFGPKGGIADISAVKEFIQLHKKGD